ncbi:MAG: uncharacterized protein PWQ25_936 [Deferribacteres bacterium]|jgi:predicted DNA-binding protein (UPF0251 family)|nr:hypothetical protein [Deferribacteraceae bacterium]MDK2792073.1 uncharacterized protein [Deferribacteres bacterium]
MGRPKKQRKINCCVEGHYFKPQGIPLSELKEVELAADEIEAIRLKYVEGLEQIAGAEKMGISQSTFQRILNSALKKVGIAIVEGMAIKILTDKNNH